MSGSSSILPLLLSLLLVLSSCSGLGKRAESERFAVTNPLIIASHHEEVAWEQVVDVLHEYHFQIERENRQAKTIETRYRVGSGLFEPWHKESVGWSNRLESTLQSIRRKVVVTLSPASHGYAVQVVALKETEDLDAVTANSPGGATFRENTTFERDLTQVHGQSRPSGWIPQGRDLELERALLTSLLKHVAKANSDK